MLVAVVVLFIICWGPILITNVLTAFDFLNRLNYGYLKPMRTAFHLMSYFNSCINPCVYGFLSANFRNSFKAALCTCICGRRKRIREDRNFSRTGTTSISIARSTMITWWLKGVSRRMPSGKRETKMWNLLPNAVEI